MRDAKLPLAYRDSCAHLLIPLNKCRRETWYAPWSCTVCFHPARSRTSRDSWTGEAAGSKKDSLANLYRMGMLGRATRLREMPVRRVQEAGGQDERAAGVKRGRTKQLGCREDDGTPCTYHPCMRNGNRKISKDADLEWCTCCHLVLWNYRASDFEGMANAVKLYRAVRIDIDMSILFLLTSDFIHQVALII